MLPWLSAYLAMRRELVDEMVSLGRTALPKEACGFVVSPVGESERVVLCENASDEPEQYFLIRPRDFANAEDAGAIVAVWHSHAGSAQPSEGDRAQCERHHIPYVIVSAEHGNYTEIEPIGWESPLEGRQWVPGVQDCADLVRDYYWRKLNIALPNPHRDDHWWMHGQDLIAKLYAEIGFVWVPKEALRANDVLVFQREYEIPHHVAVYLGDSLMLHHPYEQLSRQSNYDDHWKRSTFAVLRHRALLRPEDAYRE